MSAKLMIIAGAGLVSCFGVVQAFKYQVSNDIMNSTFYKEAMETLRKHKGAIYLLGQPIIESSAKYNSFFRDSEKTDVKVYLSGPKSKGILFFTTLADKEHEHKVNTIQLQIGSDDSKRLVIK